MPTTCLRSILRCLRSSSRPSSSLPRKSKVDGNRILKEVSDIAAFFKKEVKQSHLTLVQELTKLRTEKQKAEKALCKAQAIQEDLEATVQQITAARDAAASLVKCGHASCYGCLRDWFHTHLREQLNAEWRNIPKHLRWHPITAKTLTELYDGRYLRVMLYDCPLCEGPMRIKPIEVNNFSDFLAVANNVLGQPKDRAIDDPHLLDQDIWGDVPTVPQHVWHSLKPMTPQIHLRLNECLIMGPVVVSNGIVRDSEKTETRCQQWRNVSFKQIVVLIRNKTYKHTQFRTTSIFDIQAFC
ncbi:hypothetical protein BKA82DRAFT_4009378 [Pisolithus tinctorius]|nr:hypothetical protein BKA82DRAFT_4009378 [Pisolithus tinctorius]